MYMKKCRRAPCAVGVGRSVGWVSLTAHAALGDQTEYASLAADAHADEGMRVVVARRLSDCRRGWFAWSLGPHLTAATFLAHPRRRPLLISLRGRCARFLLTKRTTVPVTLHVASRAASR